MPSGHSSDVKLEIGHVLFIDIVGYSKLLITEQTEQIQTLKQVIRSTEQFRKAKAEGKLIGLPTGDGGALVFRTSLEAPVLCAIEISQRLKNYPGLEVRMGIHSGPVNEVADLNEQMNAAGAGINIAQRVMDCGDAGHILLSQHVADDLEQYPRWRPQLHSLGECEVKHGVRLGVVNFYDQNVGNPVRPKKFQALKTRRARLRWGAVATGAVLIAGIITAFLIVSKRAMNWSLTVPEKSIAVLPFTNMSEDQRNSYFADGVQDEILEDLAKIADLKVISRTSVMEYKSGTRNLRQIARELGVAHVLEGSVQRAANRIRVTAQLIDARNDSHVWAEHYDRALDDVFAIQSEIAKTIADQLHATLSATEKAGIAQRPTKDLEAYDLYLRALPLYRDNADPVHAQENLPQAARFLDEAVKRDPKFLSAWCLLSNTHSLMYFQGTDHSPARLELANAAAKTALLVQPDAGEAHLALAYYYYAGFRDYTQAREQLEIARRTLPNNAELFFRVGVFDYRQGRWDEATQNLERAVELDPRNFQYLTQMALCYQPQRRYQDESRAWDQALKIIPGDPNTLVARTEVDANWKADMKPYEATVAKLIAENPRLGSDVDDPFFTLRERTAAAVASILANYSRDGVNYYGVSYPRSYWEGVIARWHGDMAKAQTAFTTARGGLEEILQKQPDFPAALSLLGMIDAGLGKKEDAIREGRRACELLPMTKDAVDGVAFVVNLAQVYAWTGEKDLAIETLAKALSVPNDCHYGELKLHPIWDPLRDNPRFDKLMEQSKKQFGGSGGLPNRQNASPARTD
jgi:TolB-like protein/Flp pilus assembly protein TadD